MRFNLTVIKKTCSLAPAVALTCSLPIVFAAHSIFSFGVWARAETVVIAFHATSALCSLALILSLWHDRAKFISIIVHPFILIPTALCLWIAITAPFIPFPLLSLLGSPQQGEGALWYANLAVLVACSLYVVREKHQWRFLIIWSGLIVCGVIAIKLIAASHDTYELTWVSGFLAFIGIALPFICLNQIGGRWRWLWLVVIAASISIIIIAQSKSAMVFYAFGVGVVGIGFLFKRNQYFERFIRCKKCAMAIVGIIAITPLIVIGSGVVNEIPSLYSRFLIFKLMNEALTSDWYSWWIGQGWGRTQDALVANLNIAGENLWKPRWDYLWRNYSHSLNWIYEALYACGIIGLLITFVFYISIPYFSEPHKRLYAIAFASMYAGMNAVWFEISFSLPFVAVALASIGSEWRVNNLSIINKGPYINSAFVCLALLFVTQVTAAGSLYEFGQRSTQAMEAYKKPHSLNERIVYPRDFRGAEHGFALSIRGHLEWLKKNPMIQGAKAAALQHNVIQSIIFDLKERIPQSQSPYLVIAGIAVYSELVFDPKLKWLQYKLQGKDRVIWEQWVRRLLTLAPGRTDTAIPYLSWLLTQNQLSKVQDLTKSIINKLPHDPVGLFFMGSALVRFPNLAKKKEGLKYLRMSLDLGIEKLMPVEERLKKIILSQ